MKIYTNEIIKKKLMRKKKIEKGLGIVSYIIMAFFVLVAINVIYQKATKKNDINLFGFKAFVVVSGSMEPTINVGDMIVAKEINEEEVKVDDIITFVNNDNNMITHRIVKIFIDDGKKYYQTKGDNNPSNDVGLLTFENIKGLYCFKINRLGYVFNFLISPIGLILIISIIVLVYLHNNRKNNRKKARHLIRQKYKNENDRKGETK